MKISQILFIPPKNIPSSISMPSHKLMLRACLVQQSSTGFFAYLPLASLSLKKIISIVHHEMLAINSLPVHLPSIMPLSFLKKSKRDQSFGQSLFQFQNRHQKYLALAPTHEEIISEILAPLINSYKNLPLSLFQIQNKFRDEIRPRAGIIRTSEFIMKDAYSFHHSTQSLDSSYQKFKSAYLNIFKKLNIQAHFAAADPGNMGGSESQEFMIKNPYGEDTLVQCSHCSYTSNIQTAQAKISPHKPLNPSIPPFQLVHTPNQKTSQQTSQFLNMPPSSAIKSLLYSSNSSKTLFLILIQGNITLNETKLLQILNLPEIHFTPHSTLQTLKLPPGFIGPINWPKNIPVTLIADHSIFQITDGFSGSNIHDHHFVHVSPKRDIKPHITTDLQTVSQNQQCSQCSSPLQVHQAIELAHIFKLGKKYSKAHNITYTDQNGQNQFPTMGCYGIGINRILAASIEHNHDQNGIVWPITIAPFQVIITPINFNHPQQQKITLQIYHQLSQNHCETLLDDRNIQPGPKLKDADLIGIPIRILVSQKLIEKSSVEIKLRHLNSHHIIPIHSVLKYVSRTISLQNCRFS